jgi:mono/diheme cytochrome c family protein
MRISGWGISLGLLVAALLPAGSLAAPAQSKTEISEKQLPPPAQRKVDYDHDIKPIFEGVCFRCHGAERPRSGFSLLTKEAALKGGDNGLDIVPGQSAKSPMIHYVAGVVPDLVMPPERYPRLTPEQIGLLRAWIDQGPLWSADAQATRFQFAISPTLRWIGVNGRAAKFQELYWTRPGWSGGLGQFELKETQGVDRSVTLEGHVLPNLDDYRLALTLDQRNLGFARLGFERRRLLSRIRSGGIHPGPRTARRYWPGLG